MRQIHSYTLKPCFVCASAGTLEYDVATRMVQCSACGVSADKDAIYEALYGTPDERDISKKRDKDHCRYCGRRSSHLDHVFPVSRGGAPDPENLVCACYPCGTRKGNMTPEEAGMPLLPSGTIREIEEFRPEPLFPIPRPPKPSKSPPKPATNLLTQVRKSGRKTMVETQKPGTFTSHDARILARVEYREDIPAHARTPNAVKVARRRVLVDYFAWKASRKEPPTETEISNEFQRLWKLHGPHNEDGL